MAISQGGGLDPVLALALVGVLGVGSQWLAWRLRLPAIVLMLAAGLLVGPGLGVLNPQEQFGDMLQPMIGIAVAIILFEGGLVLNLHSLNDAAKGVRRLVIVGAPLGWAASAAVLHYVAGLGWASAAVFGGIMIVTGPTVIAPLLRQARLQKRPAALLQWEAIVNDPVGALAAVLAFEVVIVLNSATSAGHAVQQLVLGIGLAALLGVLGGYGIAKSFRRGWVPEYMKIPILFVVLIAVFAASDAVLHESGLLAVTIMGLWIANADLPSYVELRRFKEHATVLLVSGVFILLSANMSRETLSALDWRAGLFVLAVICIARPLPVLAALAFTNVPWRERALVAMTGPRGVVLVAVAGLFGERLAALGIEDGARIAPLAFALVLATVVLHGFTLTPIARFLGLTAGTTPGVLILGGSRWSVAFAQALEKLGMQVLLADPNRTHLRSAREAGVPVYYGDILSEAAEDRLDLVAFDMLISATDDDAYNTLVATDLSPEFGRSNVFQLRRVRSKSSRHALPVTLGGRAIGADETFFELNAKISEGWTFRGTNLTEEFSAEDWHAEHPNAILVAVVGKNGGLRLLGPEDELRDVTGAQVLSFGPKRSDVPNGTGLRGEEA